MKRVLTEEHGQDGENAVWAVYRPGEAMIKSGAVTAPDLDETFERSF